MQNKFNNKSAKTTFCLVSEVEQAVRDFPEKLARTVFIATPQQNTPAASGRDIVLYGCSEAIEFERSRPRHLEDIAAIIESAAKAHGSIVFYHKSTDQHFLCLQDRGYMHSLFRNADFCTAHSFDHELGHILSKDGKRTSGNDPLGETIADCYAALRSVQRFGADALEPLFHHAGIRARGFIRLNSASHLTTLAADALLHEKTVAQIQSLTPRQTLALAEKYAYRYQPALDDLLRIKQELFEFCDIETSSQTQSKLVKNLLSTDDVYLFSIGARALMPQLDPGDNPLTTMILPLGLRIEYAKKLSLKAEYLGLQTLALKFNAAHDRLTAASSTQQKPPGSKATGRLKP